MRIIGHGIDIVSIERIAALAADHAERFLERCYTPDERSYQAGSRRYHEHLAARFAAKEAVMKALGTGLDNGILWTDIEVVRSPRGEPGLRLTGRAAEIAASRGIRRWLISLSHTNDLAVASVLGLADEA
ncbi:MAG: holo-ACP synthase [Phycisphaerales bacterium]